MNSPRPVLSTLLAATVVSLAACGGGDAGPSLPVMDVQYDTVADTVFVHTRSGQSWPGDATLVEDVSIGVLDGPEEYIFGSLVSLAVGPSGEIFVMDRQVPALRVYEADGTYRTTFGRGGQGPGEYERPDGGMAVIGDRLVVRDPGNARLTLFGLDGEHLGEWRLNGSLSTGSQLWWDPEGNTYTPQLKESGVPVTEWEWVMVKYGPDGQVLDSLDAPKDDIPEGVNVASREGSSSSSNVPFFPRQGYTFSPNGYFVHHVNSRYGVKLLRTDAPHLVMGRDYDPIPVPARLASSRRQAIEENFRSQFPGWRWNGPEIPDVMPPFQNVYSGIDGRLWVSLYQPYTEEDNPDFDPSEEGSEPTRWVTGTAFDVFEPDGTYLGKVDAPDNMVTYPRPIFGPDWVIATTRDEFDVTRVVRFHIDIPAADTQD